MRVRGNESSNSNRTNNTEVDPPRADQHNIRNSERLLDHQNKILQKCIYRKIAELAATQWKGDPNHVYDDDVVSAISEEAADRITVIPVIGDFIRFLGGILGRRRELTAEEFLDRGLELLFADHVHRQDVAELTKIGPVRMNQVVPFMNGGPAGENWDKGANGFFDWINNKSRDSILGVELGFKADDYGLKVANLLIQKKRANPDMYIGILIDGFVSIMMQKAPQTLQQFEQNTLTMIKKMSDAGIDVTINSSFDPLSDDFFAANHIKLWIFDGEAAFFGGIGIETQFQTRMYDEMDLTQGRFVNILTLIALLLIKSQRAYDNPLLGAKKHDPLTKEEVLNRFIRKPEVEGNTWMKVMMDVPGYVQDAHDEYVRLLKRKDISEIYIIAPYFSDHKVARALVRTADKMSKKVRDENFRRTRYASDSGNPPPAESITLGPSDEKRIHVVFPKKQENMIIADVSKYYAHYLRDNPIVETRQYTVQMQDQTFNMLHAKQMVLVVKDKTKNRTKYVKFGGSYNPAGRAQNMWELNAVQVVGDWNQSDEGPESAETNPIRDYLNNVVKVLVEEYTEPFPWGTVDYKLSLRERIAMYIAKSLWF